MKKLIIIGTICLALVVITPFLFITHMFRSSGDNGSLGLQSCIIDTDKILEELTDEETGQLDGLEVQAYKNEVISMTLHQERSPTLQQTITNANIVSAYAQSVDQVLTKSTFIQSVKYGNPFIDFLKKYDLNDTTIELNLMYEEQSGRDETLQTDALYYVAIQSEFAKSYCAFGATGFPANPPYRITGWFPSYNQNGTGGYHDGIDLGLDIGTPLFSTSNGEVVLTSSGCSNDGSMQNKCGGTGDDGLAGISGLGNFVIIKVTGEDIYIAYAHLSSPVVKVGDIVVPGQQIGLSGNSGKSSGAHLHFVVARSNNMYDVTNSLKVIDPCTYVLGLCSE